MNRLHPVRRPALAFVLAFVVPMLLPSTGWSARARTTPVDPAGTSWVADGTTKVAVRVGRRSLRRKSAGTATIHFGMTPDLAAGRATWTYGNGTDRPVFAGAYTTGRRFAASVAFDADSVDAALASVFDDATGDGSGSGFPDGTTFAHAHRRSSGLLTAVESRSGARTARTKFLLSFDTTVNPGPEQSKFRVTLTHRGRAVPRAE